LSDKANHLVEQNTVLSNNQNILFENLRKTSERVNNIVDFTEKSIISSREDHTLLKNLVEEHANKQVENEYVRKIVKEMAEGVGIQFNIEESRPMTEVLEEYRRVGLELKEHQRLRDEEFKRRAAEREQKYQEDLLRFRKDQARRERETWEAISEKNKVEPLFSPKWWGNVRTYFPGWFGSFPWYFKMFLAGRHRNAFKGPGIKVFDKYLI
jgi:hypothetical protein